MQTFNPDFKERVARHIEKQYFLKHIGFQIIMIEEGRIEGELEIQQFHKQQRGFFHGGLVATVADIVAGFAAYTLVPNDHHVVTAEIKVSFLNPGTGAGLNAIGWVLKQGRKMNFCESEVWSVDGDRRQLIAKATATMATIFPGDFKP